MKISKGGLVMNEASQTATATDVQNHFGKYLQYAIDHGEVVILRNGKRIARIVSDQSAVRYLTDSLQGVLKGDVSQDQAKSERMKKYESVD